MSDGTTTLMSLKEAMKRFQPHETYFITPGLVLCEVLVDRVDHKLQALSAQFKQLDLTKDNLTQKFEHHSKMLASQAAQDELWMAVLELKFASLELNIIGSYVTDVLVCLHTRVLEKLPDLAGGLPTLTSIFRRKAKNERIGAAWESVLKECGLREGDVMALRTFFIAHGDQAEHYGAKARQVYIRDVTSVVTSAVQNQALRGSLLKAVRLIEMGTQGQPLKHGNHP